MSELQYLHKDIVIDGNLCKKVSEVYYPIKSYEEIFVNQKTNVLEHIDISIERGSFISKSSLAQHMPAMLSFMKSLVTFDSNHKHTKFESPVYSLIPVLVTDIAHKSRRDSGFRSCHRCARYVTDPKYFPKRMSDFQTLFVQHEGMQKLAFHWTYQVPASMARETCLTKACITYDGHLHYHDCNCEAAWGKDNKVKGKKMVCMHTCPCIMKLSMILIDCLSDDLCYELASKISKKDYYDKHDDLQKKSIEDSLKTLASVGIISRGETPDDNMSKMKTTGILKAHFNSETERMKQPYSANYVSQLEHVPLKKLGSHSMISAGKNPKRRKQLKNR